MGKNSKTVDEIPFAANGSVHTFVLVRRLGFDVELLGTTDNKDVLRKKLRDEVKQHLDNYYDDGDEYAVDIKKNLLAQLEKDDTNWTDCDEDRTYELNFSIMEVPCLY